MAGILAIPFHQFLVGRGKLVRAGQMRNFHSQRTGAADAAGEVLLSLVVELSESEALPLFRWH